MISCRQTEPPETLAVSLDFIKQFLKIDGDDLNAVLEGYIKSAIDQVEGMLGRSLITQTREVWMDSYDLSKREGAITLLFPPVQSIESVSLYGEDNTEVELAETSITLEDSVLWVKFVDEELTSITELRAEKTMKIVYVAGYGDADTDVPNAIKSCIADLVRVLYDGVCDICEEKQRILKMMLDYQVPRSAVL